MKVLRKNTFDQFPRKHKYDERPPTMFKKGNIGKASVSRSRGLGSYSDEEYEQEEAIMRQQALDSHVAKVNLLQLIKYQHEHQQQQRLLDVVAIAKATTPLVTVAGGGDGSTTMSNTNVPSNITSMATEETDSWRASGPPSQLLDPATAENILGLEVAGPTTSTSTGSVDAFIPGGDRCQLLDDTHRIVSYAIQRNKSFKRDKKKTKKALSHSRVSYRRRYNKAMIKYRSQIPTRTYAGPYCGEPRGIRQNVIRSIKFV